MTVNNSNPSMYDLAKMILHDACPPDNRMYLCKIGEEQENRCEECWSNYLLWAASGYPENRRPYRWLMES